MLEIKLNHNHLLYELNLNWALQQEEEKKVIIKK